MHAKRWPEYLVSLNHQNFCLVTHQHESFYCNYQIQVFKVKISKWSRQVCIGFSIEHISTTIFKILLPIWSRKLKHLSLHNYYHICNIPYVLSHMYYPICILPNVLSHVLSHRNYPVCFPISIILYTISNILYKCFIYLWRMK